MKILAISDAGCTTGFGLVGDALYRRWAAAGHTVDVLAINYRGDPWQADYRLWPANKYHPQDVYGMMRVTELLDRVKPDVVFILNDLPVINQYLLGNQHDPTGRLRQQPLLIYAPIDCCHLPPTWVQGLSYAQRVILQSQWGADILADEFGITTAVLPHGIDTELFAPVSDRYPLRLAAIEDGTERVILATNKTAVKSAFHFDDRFVVLAVNRNSVRKNYGDTFRVFAEFAKDKPDALLYIHAAAIDEGGNLGDLVLRYHLEQQVRISPNVDTFEGFPVTSLVAFYNMADVFLSTSLGEGFGLTAAEALACGTPVVAQDFSAFREVVGRGGILVPSERLFTSGRGVDLSYPDWRAMVDALNTLYEDDKLREQLGRRGRQHITSPTFQWDRIAQAFIEHLRAVAEAGPVR